MKLQAIAWLAGGVVLGFVLGGMPARREARALQEERDALRARLDAAERPNLLQAFLPQLDAPRESEAAARASATAQATAVASSAPHEREHARGEAPARPAAQGDVAVIGADDERAHVPGTVPPVRGFEPSGPNDHGVDLQGSGERAAAASDAPRRRASALLSNFDQLVSVQRARIAASRAALVEQAELDDQQVARLDRSLERMNGKLLGYGEEVIAQATSDEPPSPAQALGLGHDVSGILYEGQQELDAVVGEAAERVDSSAREIWNYVDIEQWKPIVDQKLGERSAAQGVAEGAPAGSAGAAAPPSE